MIAHPERNKDVMRNSKKLEPFLQLGCLLQITADSVAGSFGEQAEYIAHQLVAEGHATILASDGHNLKHRPPRLKPGLHAATKLIGEQEATALVLDTPKAISLGQFSHACSLNSGFGKDLSNHILLRNSSIAAITFIYFSI